MVIGLCGLKGAGKDTVAAYLIKQYRFERRAFADPLKRSVAALFDIPFNEIDRMKNDPTVKVAVGYKTEGPDVPGKPDHMWSPARELSFRELLQRYGTESHREVFGYDFWLDATLPEQVYTGRKIVVTDCRFFNELERIKSVDGFIVEVSRPSTGATDTHPSEVEWRDWESDYVLHNDGTIVDLFAGAELMINDLSVRSIESLQKN